MFLAIISTTIPTSRNVAGRWEIGVGGLKLRTLLTTLSGTLRDPQERSGAAGGAGQAFLWLLVGTTTRRDNDHAGL